MIAGLVLAAGLSRRMGSNKLLLAFGERTVLGQIVSVLQNCPLDAIIVVTGHERDKLEAAFDQASPSLRFVYNLNYANGDMLSSIQAGLAAMPDDCEAALVVLGDQPRIQKRIVEQVVAAHEPGQVVIPSHGRHGGHPILIDRACWPEILALPPGASLRTVWRAHPDWRRYLHVDTDSILRDMDTPEDYHRMIEP